MPGLIDIGANLLHPQFDADRVEVLARARAAGVERLVITATDLDAARRITQFLDACAPRAEWPVLHTTAGIHPHDAAHAAPGWMQTLSDLLDHPAVVAVGETGLDFNRNFSPADTQRRVFNEQIGLAIARDQPLFVHDRESNGEVISTLERSAIRPERVVIHCFTGTADELDACLAAGYSVGITGWVCDRRRGESLRELVPRIPLSRLLIETDAPFLLPHDLPPTCPKPHGRRNEPAYLAHIARALATLMNVSEDALERATRANAISFFRLQP